MNPITLALSKASGIPEPTIRLLLTLILAYPVSIIYNKRFFNPAKPSTSVDRTRYIASTGFALNFFFNGLDIYHSLVTISVSYAIVYFFNKYQGERKIAAGAIWIFNAVYLLWGYYTTQTDDYDISWTMTQCILCLRLMGFGFDYYDGRTKVAKMEEEVNKTGIRENLNKKPSQALPLSFGADTPLEKVPGVIDMLAYCLFPSAFLVGPQFSYSLFKKWIMESKESLTNEQLKEREQAKAVYVWRCVLLSVLYLGLQQTVGAKYSTSYLLTEEYSSLSLLKRLFIFFVSGKFGYNKYIGIWLLTEGACASFGISYEGMDSDGHAQYGGLANALPRTFQLATSIDHIIGSFNINTNLWSKYYVFKRLKFLGSKQLSQFGTLFFLAIWHGFHPMYFVTFLLEFLDVQCELVFRKRIAYFVQPYTKQYPAVHYLWKFVAWCSCQMCISYAMVGFELLSVDRAIAAYKSVYFIGHIIVPVIFAVDRLAPKPMVLKKKAQ